MINANIDWNSKETLKDFVNRCIQQGYMPLDIEFTPFPRCWIELYREDNDGKAGSKQGIVAWFQAKLNAEFGEKRRWQQAAA